MGWSTLELTTSFYFISKADDNKNNFDKSIYKENPDGSIDVELTLYFKSQSYFYLGLIISGMTLVGCLGYLEWGMVKRRKKRKGVKEIDG